MRFIRNCLPVCPTTSDRFRGKHLRECFGASSFTTTMSTVGLMAIRINPSHLQVEAETWNGDTSMRQKCFLCRILGNILGSRLGTLPSTPFRSP